MAAAQGSFAPGRRVSLRDLIAAGLLEVGTALQWTRPNVGQNHRATIDESGRILLEDGRAFSAPSRAANEAVGSGSFDGWLAWRVANTNRLLDSVRQEFLERAAQRQLSAEAPAQDLQAEQMFLREARRRADAGDPIVEPVKDLLAHWGVVSRDLAAVDRISADLENHGLITVPSFLKVSLDSPIRLDTEYIDAHDGKNAEQSTSEEDVLEVGVTLGNLLEQDAPLVWVRRESSLDEAITLMLLNDYSQLPVMANERSLRGAITWQSIAKASHANLPATVAAALVHCSLKSYADELVDVLGLLQNEDFVLVKDATNRIVGIITAADVVQKYGELATPYFLVGELDQYLRRIISDRFSIERVRRVCQQSGHNLDDFGQMTMGDYQAVLEDPDCWAEMEWPLDRRSFIKRFNEMRVLRNNLLHFNRDRVRPVEIDKLRRLIQILKTYALQ